MFSTFVNACLAVGFSFATLAQDFELVEIPRPKRSTYPFSQVEPSIAIDPTNPQRMIAGTILNDYYFSKDGGESWVSRSIHSRYRVHGDPVLHIDQQGKFYYFHLSNPIFGHWIDRIVCQRSNRISGGYRSSATAVNSSKAQDKHWVSECPVTGNLYLTWTEFDEYASEDENDHSRIMFSKSTDQGNHWSLPKTISAFEGDCRDGDNTVEGAVPAVNSKGEVFVTWTGPNGIMLNISKDKGKTWLTTESNIQEHPGGWSFFIPGINRSNGLPILKIDQSNGEYKDRLYVNWADQGDDTTNTEIWMIYSDDNGETWSDRVKVNQDKSGKHQFFTWMDIDQTNGDLFFIYYDRRAHNDAATDVYLAYSFDGGKTIKERKISKESFTPQKEIFFGDYLNIAAHDGVIRPIWPSMDESGQISLWVALINAERLD
jgi:hypothetical protein